MATKVAHAPLTEARDRSVRIASAALAPFGFLWSGKEIIAQFVTAFVASYLSILQVPRLSVWLPDPSARHVVLVMSSLVLATLAALPAVAERRSVGQLRVQLRSCYQRYIIDMLEAQLDDMLTALASRFDLGQLTASIMVPRGAAMLERARQLHIVAASRLLRPLPSMALRLDWDEGVAGRIWKEGSKAAALPVKNDVKWLSENGIRPISKSKRRDGSFGHNAAICFPINFLGRSRRDVKFMGVLSIGSDRGDDFDVFASREFQFSVYPLLKEGIAEHVHALLLADDERASLQE